MATSSLESSISAEVTKLVEPVYAVKAAGRLADKTALETHAIPSHEEVDHRQRALQQLQQILLGNDTQSLASRLPPQLVVVPIGAHGLDVWTSASADLDCICIGVYSTATFLALAVQRLRVAGRGSGDGNNTSWSVRRVRTAAGETALRIGDGDGLHIRLQYCQAAAVAETWPAFLTKPPALSTQTLARLKAVRDLHYLRQSFPAYEENEETGHRRICTAALFSAAHRAIQTWACARGLYAARFGYLGDMQIAVLLARVMKLMQAEGEGEYYLLPDILVTFFRHYATFDWKTKMAFDPFFHHDKTPHVSTAREPMVILGYHRPQLNTSQAATASSTRVLAAEFQRADRVLSTGSMTWEAFLRGDDGSIDDEARSLLSGPADFVHAYDTFLKIDLQYWSLSLQRSTAFMHWLESHSLFLLSADLARRLPEVHTRTWPGRFTENEDASADSYDNKVGEYRGFYLVGIDLPANMSTEKRQLCMDTLQSVLAAFERQVRNSSGSGSAYDPQRMWLGTDTVSRADLGDLNRLGMDVRAWGGEHSDEEDEEDENDEEEAEWGGSDEDSKEKKKKKGKKENENDRETAAVAHPSGRGKFRSAQDVIKRLRWDPSLDPADYIVGYEDRFVGACERALDAWKSEQTDDEFIPQHRILYFRRCSDGMVVWDRRSRQDDVFGSS